ncbi:DUF1304 family protein [Phreatobacter sp.]|uniref:DUF1304 family protein n=1 Tax=Phreatobacter sp. TaxID=1966341 RepID=UPI0025D36B80|nr:DUF1304 family protein [Phreatobacter sp.]
MVFWHTPIGLGASNLRPERGPVGGPRRQSGPVQRLSRGGADLELLAPKNCALPLAIFFLGCVDVACLIGAATAKMSIFFVQATPAALAIGAVLMARDRT